MIRGIRRFGRILVSMGRDVHSGAHGGRGGVAVSEDVEHQPVEDLFVIDRLGGGLLVLDMLVEVVFRDARGGWPPRAWTTQMQLHS